MTAEILSLPGMLDIEVPRGVGVFFPRIWTAVPGRSFVDLEGRDRHLRLVVERSLPEVISWYASEPGAYLTRAGDGPSYELVRALVHWVARGCNAFPGEETIGAGGPYTLRLTCACCGVAPATDDGLYWGDWCHGCLRAWSATGGCDCKEK